jgi:hypothetical protein
MKKKKHRRQRKWQVGSIWLAAQSPFFFRLLPAVCTRNFHAVGYIANVILAGRAAAEIDSHHCRSR